MPADPPSPAGWEVQPGGGFALLDALLDAVIMADRDGRITYANAAVAGLLGWSAEELRGAPLTSIVPTRLREAHRQAFCRVVHGGTPTLLGGPPIALQALHRGGHEVEVELSLAMREGGDGDLWVVGVLRDVSARRRLEQAESRSRYLALSAEVTRRIALVGDVHSIEEAGEIVLGTVGEMIGWDAAVLWVVEEDDGSRPIGWWSCEALRDAMPELADPRHHFPIGRGLPGRVVERRLPAWIEDVTADHDFPRHVIATRHDVTTAFAFPIVGANRVLAVVELLSRPQRQVDTGLLGIVGQIGGSVGQFLERRLASDELHASKARKAAVLDSTFDAVVSIDHRGRIIQWNRAAEATFGWSHAEALERPLGEVLIPERLRLAHVEGLARHLRTGEARIIGKPVELTALRRDGTEIPVEVAITRLQGVEPPEFIGVVRDISARKQAEAALAEGRERLRAIAEMLQESLLPATLPEVPGLEVGAAYRPAGDGTLIGGDFYDLLRVGDGRWVAMIGDVCGKGAEAARVTALVRYTLRASALQADDPVEAVRRCNEAVRGHRPNRFCTAAYVEVDVGTPTRVRTVRAGHTLPLVLRADGTTQTLEGVGTLLGVVRDPALQVVPADLGPGDALVLCTDGVTEARVGDRLLGEHGFARELRAAAGLDAQGIATHLHDRVVAMQGGRTRDDLAVLVLRQPT